MSDKKSSFHHDTGKGSRPRPYEVSQEEFTKKFDAIDWSVKMTDDKNTFHIIAGSIESADGNFKLDADGNLVIKNTVIVDKTEK